jgi:hypothetical protein
MDILTTRCMLFILSPIEMCILPTYIIMTYILKGIEAIIFEPILYDTNSN